MSMETVEYYDLTTTTTPVPRQDESHQCVTCGESFTENIDLQIHMFNMDHHGQVFTSEAEVFTSEVEGFTSEAEVFTSEAEVFTSEAEVFTSEAVVQDEVPCQTNGNYSLASAKTYHCKQCDKTFKAKGLFVAHKVLHSGGHRYRCVECGKAYVHQKNLERHMNIHTGKNLYSCNMCGKSFTRKNGLKIHGQCAGNHSRNYVI